MRQTTGFARSSDGGRIAFAVVGSGPALVMPAWWVSSVVDDWGFEPFRRFVEGLAAGRTVVRYDRVGTGLSERERRPETFTPEFEVAALRAVVDELALERVTLIGISCGGCTAVTFAARWSERVDRLVLYGSYADGHGLGPPEARRGMVGLVRSHWGLGSRLLADVFGPSWSAENRAAFTAVQRASADAEVTLRPPPGRPELLVKLLACHGGRLPAEQAIELLWPEVPPQSGRKRMRNVLNRLQASVPAVVSRDGEVLSLGDVEIDAELFEYHARHALAASQVSTARIAITQYRGPVLPDDPFEPWAADTRERLERLFLQLLDAAAARAEAGGEIDEAVRLSARALDSLGVPTSAHHRELVAAARGEVATV